MLKCIALLRKRADLSRDAFIDRFEHHHAVLIRRLLPEIVDYRRNYMVREGAFVFAATPEGNLIALNARSGAALWRFQTGATIAASPMSYAVDGKHSSQSRQGQCSTVSRCPTEP